MRRSWLVFWASWASWASWVLSEATDPKSTTAKTATPAIEPSNLTTSAPPEPGATTAARIGTFTVSPKENEGEERPREIVYVLPRTQKSNFTSIRPKCLKALIACQNTSSNFSPAARWGPLRPNAQAFSSLIKYRRQRGRLHLPVEVNDDFIQHLLLLHNNTDQLRVLLTLLRGVRGRDWMSFLAGYNECERPNSVIYTCVNDTCEGHDLLRLRYTTDVFAENVIGLELAPPAVFLLVLLRNNATKTSGVVRIRAETASFLDATYNLLRAVSDELQIAGSLTETVLRYLTRLPGVFSTTGHYQPRVIPRPWRL